MAIEKTDVTSTNNLSGTSGTSTAFLPVAGQLYEIWVGSRHATAAPVPTSLTHSSFSAFTKVDDEGDGTLRCLSVWRGVCDLTPASEGVVVDFGASSQGCIIIRVKTYTGTNASDPVVQFKSGSGTSTTAAVTFDAATTAGNAVSAAIMFSSDSETVTWDATMAAAGNAISGNSQATRLYNGFVAGQEDSPSGVISSSLAFRIVAWEIAAAVAAVVGQSTSNRTTRRRRR